MGLEDEPLLSSRLRMLTGTSSGLVCISALHALPLPAERIGQEQPDTPTDTMKSVLASNLNVQEFCPRAQNHVGRVAEIRKRAFSHPNIFLCTPQKPSTKRLDI